MPLYLKACATTYTDVGLTFILGRVLALLTLFRFGGQCLLGLGLRTNQGPKCRGSEVVGSNIGKTR